ncbi:hypothetical protein ACJX0J_013086, partial [Zea mays]
ISEHDTELIETVMCHFREKFENLPEKFNGVEEQLFQEFSLDDLFPLVAPLFMETPHSCSMYAEKAEQCFDEDTTSFLCSATWPSWISRKGTRGFSTSCSLTTLRSR